jgi:hypothetical protein
MGVLPTIVCHCVCPRNLKNEAACIGLLHQWEKIVRYVLVPCILWFMCGSDAYWFSHPKFNKPEISY